MGNVVVENVSSVLMKTCRKTRRLQQNLFCNHICNSSFMVGKLSHIVCRRQANSKGVGWVCLVYEYKDYSEGFYSCVDDPMKSFPNAAYVVGRSI